MGYDDQTAMSLIFVRVPPTLKAELERRCALDRRPLSEWLRLLLIDLVERGESDLLPDATRRGTERSGRCSGTLDAGALDAPGPDRP